MRQPEIRSRLAGVGAEPIGSTPAQLGQHLRQELSRWSKLVAERNIRID